ncbi:MAG: CYTH domain-containing protein [Clostridiales bacterium]|nr:CYTH domain-containing protein [Clostridiales bacterium]
MIEKEYKFLLDKEQFFKIQRAAKNIFKHNTKFLQINYYYDDENGSLSKQDTTLRVRQMGDSLLLQKKWHIMKSGTAVVSDETEAEITSLPNVIDDKYCLMGSLVTQRVRVFMKDSSGYIDFDRNYYLGVCDYEVEIEITSGAEKIAEKCISLLKLDSTSAVKGKSTRFFEKLHLFGKGKIDDEI